MQNLSLVRYYSLDQETAGDSSPKDREITFLMVGLFERDDAKSADTLQFTATGSLVNEKSGNQLQRLIERAAFSGKEGEMRVFFSVPLGQQQPVNIAVVGLGKAPAKATTLEREEDVFVGTGHSIRSSVFSAVRDLKKSWSGSASLINVHIEPFLAKNSSGEAESACWAREAAEGAFTGVFEFDVLKSAGTNGDNNNKKRIQVSLLSAEKYGLQLPPSAGSVTDWSIGRVTADAVNWVRYVAEMPSNHMTPRIFSEHVEKRFEGVANVTVTVRDENWIESQNMGAFMAVAKGSDEKPRFLEVRYAGAPDSPDVTHLALVGKGVCFDSGGISIKPAADMGLMRGDMGGAASVMGTMFGIASQKMPLNVIALTPLCENMPSGRAVKPGDVVRAMSNLTIEVDNTDAEGRLILADALHYAHTFNPQFLVDVATLTGAIDVALGSAASGVFAYSDKIWRLLREASIHTGDKMWRMPFFPEYNKQIKSSLADVKNTGGRSGGACTAAAFLKKFVKLDNYAHVDIAGVAWKQDPHVGANAMTGRPTRALIEFARLVAAQPK